MPSKNPGCEGLGQPSWLEYSMLSYIVAEGIKHVPYNAIEREYTEACA